MISTMKILTQIVILIGKILIPINYKLVKKLKLKNNNKQTVPIILI